jgi:hypothetical protein
MADSSETAHERRKLVGWKFLVAVLLVAVYSGAAAYAIMSDTSIRGLTVKMFNILRYCPPSSSVTTLDYNIRGSIWSTTSLATSISHVSFTLSVDGLIIGTAAGSGGSFGPGQSVPFNVTFTHPTLLPTTLPKSSQLILTLGATVAAGLFSATETSSDSNVQTFGNTGC